MGCLRFMVEPRSGRGSQMRIRILRRRCLRAGRRSLGAAAGAAGAGAAGPGSCGPKVRVKSASSSFWSASNTALNSGEPASCVPPPVRSVKNSVYGSRLRRRCRRPAKGWLPASISRDAPRRRSRPSAGRNRARSFSRAGCAAARGARAGRPAAPRAPRRAPGSRSPPPRAGGRTARSWSSCR